MLYKTYGNTQNKDIISLSYKREGLQIIVASIPQIPKLITSNPITITLEIAVSYPIRAVPLADDFEDFVFLTNSQYKGKPAVLFEPSKGVSMTFIIQPKSGASLGSHKITWTKVEDNLTNKFSEISDSFFEVVAKPGFREIKAIL